MADVMSADLLAWARDLAFLKALLAGTSTASTTTRERAEIVSLSARRAATRFRSENA